ncbi:MAG: hypothetical protein ACRDG8_07230 [Actinomycetota bacterium]
MPIGRSCRSCGAALPPDLRRCSGCYAPVTTFTARAPLHEPGAFVGSLTPTPSTSRWHGGATSFGPVGRILCTLALQAFFPWWGLAGFNPFFLWSLMGWLLAAVIVLRSVWKREPLTGPAPAPRWARYRERHPVLGMELRLGGNGRTLLVVLAFGCAAAAWLSFDDGMRYLWAAVAIVAGVGIFLGTWNDL